ncbi:hypothetical protein BI004_gp161 [Bacillus phage NotTheCreek]|nr:hypothetical protein BI004_gp161 [Bacillus phage NotTheCreek]AMW63380.1 hypothetical protein NOTTHECREEK_161 [Bacillus phage NotTheCreek]ANI24777.1 hypothetical protein SMUDGE_158 [Bacillus phage Smudge]AOZ61785.1 hypothetical protein BJ4_162 [Bacillus phage BJ4]
MGKIEELIKLLGQTKKLDVYQSDWDDLLDLDHLLRRLVEMTEEEIEVRMG